MTAPPVITPPAGEPSMDPLPGRSDQRFVDDASVSEGALSDRPEPSDRPKEASRLRLDEQLCFALYAATNEIIRVYRPLLAELGLTYPQYLLLMALWEDDDQTVTQLGETLRLPAHGLLPVLTRLEQAGLLRRARDAADRRVVRIMLTPTGRALERQAAAVQHQVACQTRLSSSALAGLRTQLHHLTDDLGAD